MATRSAETIQTPAECSSYDELLACLRTACRDGKLRIIRIEGFMASGKSHLAKRLAADLECAWIETDNMQLAMLHPDQDTDEKAALPYVDCIVTSALLDALAAAQACAPIVIIVRRWPNLMRAG